MKYDVCVIGGGAAGLAAAASFNKELKVCIIEKNSKPGRKIYATGGGRCNLTNEKCVNVRQVLEFFRKLGLETFRDAEGRYYPYSEKATDVVETLVNSLGNNVSIRCGFTVHAVNKTGAFSEEAFIVEGTEKGKTENIEAAKIVLATGGKAAPQYGTTGDGYIIAKALGHRVTRIFPILSAVECSADNTDFSELKGIRARGVLTLYKDGRALVSEKGEIQFTEDGISGICAFNITPYIKAENSEKPSEAMKRFQISVDLAPDFREEDIGNRSGSFGIVTKKLAAVVDPENLKKWRLRVDGVKGWKHAQATSGGIKLDEINMETMESHIVKGLYFAGEIIDVQGPCGGFNLQNAWETGIRAAEAINSGKRNVAGDV